MCIERTEGYWTVDQEADIVFRLQGLLTHPQVRVIGQNLLYDSQYTWKHWHFVPRVVHDTMIGQHSIFSDIPKGLAFIASMYCDYYVYWKEESKTWEASLAEDQLWHYNCEDCVYTYEVSREITKTANILGLSAIHQAQQRMFWPVLQAMLRGVKIDTKRRAELILEVQEAVAQREQFLIDVLGHPINPESPKQMHCLFYEDLKLPVQMTRAVKNQPAKPTLNDEALQRLAKIQPLVRPLVNAVCDIRTLNKFLSNFLCRPLSADSRMRCSYNIGGSESGKSAPKTYRLSSSQDAFGSGTNLQTIPSEQSKSIGKAAARGTLSCLGDPYQFPNIREIFIPDANSTWFDLDLERADLFVVCWEAEDELLKSAMRMGVDIHLLNTYALVGKEPPPLDELVKHHPRYEGHYESRKHDRQYAKVFVHGTNYGGKARTMAAHCGRTVHEIDLSQQRWFGAHPGILRWHNRVAAQITSRRFIENKFGYRWIIFDRPDSILPEAIAWIPQSTVSIVINRIWLNIYERLPDVQVLLQLHDSICGQFRGPLDQLKEVAKVTIPYDDPLVIPVSIKTSERSWGHCA
jgi:DNA polymerase I-like protein with 3'-5' exonuclease and polymerase domains